MQRYLDDRLRLVDEALSRANALLLDRLVDAMWFGRHLATFTPASFDVIEAGDRLSAEAIEGYKTAFKAKIETVLEQSGEFAAAGNVCTPRELSEVMFCFGLTWKEG